MTHGCGIHFRNRGLFSLNTWRFKPLVTGCFNRIILGPAEPGAIAMGAESKISSRVDAIRTRMPGVEDMPATLTRQGFGRAALTNRAPIGRDEIHIHADGTQQRIGHFTHSLERGLILADQQRDGLTIIARLTQQRARRFNIARPLQDIATRFSIKRRAGREEGRQGLPQRFVIADHRTHIVFLVQYHRNRTARAHIIERRMQMVEAEGTDIA